VREGAVRARARPPPAPAAPPRSVLYVDIDIHHGDGVEEAFLTSNRVLTASFHKFGGGFFPGTGSVHNVGSGEGSHYALNAPLRDGITDDAYASLFVPVMDAAVAKFDPGAIVVQCGADSLAGDRLGRFNLSSTGHAAAVTHMARYGRPTLVLGGGGYKISNVARCWAGETGALLGAPMAEQLPANEYTDFYGPDYQLAVPVRERERRDGGGGGRCALDSHSSPPSPSLQSKPGLDNANSPDYLATLRTTLLKHVAAMGSAPSVAIGGERPPDAPEPEAAPLWDKGADAGDDEPPARPE